jgi:hypothetical protein
MSDYVDRTTKTERDARRDRAKLLTEGFRGSDHLTTGERMLLDRLRAAGYEIATGRVYSVRNGVDWQHARSERRIS